jgi:DNA-binding transcriptional LysR family regulator
VRISTTDTVLHGLVAPALQGLHKVHPLLSFELHAGNELASLTRRDADIAVRATKRPPQHLVGLGLGVGIVPLFVAEARNDVVRLTQPLDECETELWLLTHPESRHLRRVAVVYSHLAQAVAMP